MQNTIWSTLVLLACIVGACLACGTVVFKQHKQPLRVYDLEPLFRTPTVLRSSDNEHVISFVMPPINCNYHSSKYPLFCVSNLNGKSPKRCITHDDAVIDVVEKNDQLRILMSSKSTPLKVSVSLKCARAITQTPVMSVENRGDEFLLSIHHAAGCAALDIGHMANGTVFRWAQDISSTKLTFSSDTVVKSALGSKDWAAAKAMPWIKTGDSFTVVIDSCNTSATYGSVVIGIERPTYPVDGLLSIPGKSVYGIGYAVSGQFISDTLMAPSSRPGDKITFTRGLDTVSVLKNYSPIGKFSVPANADLLPMVALMNGGGVTIIDPTDD